jgi:mycothiol system anti-sigma-R factor
VSPILGAGEGAPTHRCSDLAERIERYLDGELGPEQIEELRGHLADCLPCTDEVEVREQIRALVRQECAELAPVDLVARVRARLATAGSEDAARG